VSYGRVIGYEISSRAPADGRIAVKETRDPGHEEQRTDNEPVNRRSLNSDEQRRHTKRGKTYPEHDCKGLTHLKE
jgi:hypothetical protein